MKKIKTLPIIAALTFSVGVAIAQDSGQLSGNTNNQDIIAGSQDIERAGSTANFAASSFLDRAFRTRVGNRGASIAATSYTGLCLPQGSQKDKLVESVLNDVTLAKSGINQADASRVLHTIYSKYPC